MESKEEKLKTLEGEMETNTSLPLRESNLVFGVGNIDSEVMFIGEGPGFYEDKMKRPFVGRAGQLLDKLIIGIGWKREDVYITNIVKRRPPGNRDPLPEEIESYKPYLTCQIEIISPKIIVPLGRFAMNYFLPAAKITRDNGKVFRSGKCCVIPLFHPAAALRSTQVLEELTEEFSKLPQKIKECESLLLQPEEPQKESPESQKTLF
ncbi:MAG: uracil-DNA glycosylase [Candidatus Jorgensenbacteria bacterium]